MDSSGILDSCLFHLLDDKRIKGRKMDWLLYTAWGINAVCALYLFSGKTKHAGLLVMITFLSWAVALTFHYLGGEL